MITTQGVVLTLLSAAVALCCTAYASSGDTAWDFRVCLHQCTQGSQCTGRHAAICQRAAACHSSGSLPWVLQLTRWDCQDDCKYWCMLGIEAHRVAAAHPAQQYYGKWPFQRVAGMQEVASVIASLLNLAAHAAGLAELHRVSYGALWGSGHPGRKQQQQQQQRRGTKRDGSANRGGYPLLGWATAYGVSHLLAWAASVLFHTRDTRMTERVDYACAVAVFHLGLALAAERLMHQCTPQWRRRHSRAVICAHAAATASGLAWHLQRLLGGSARMDYGWNVKVCVVLGVATSGLWILWLVAEWWQRLSGRRRLIGPSASMPTPHAGRVHLIAFLTGAHAALLLELLDFPPVGRLPPLLAEVGSWAPWQSGPAATASSTHAAAIEWSLLAGVGLVDAHALWHFATVPLTWLFYRFLCLDAAELNLKEGIHIATNDDWHVQEYALRARRRKAS